jgi:hypothetical protein
MKKNIIIIGAIFLLLGSIFYLNKMYNRYLYKKAVKQAIDTAISRGWPRDKIIIYSPNLIEYTGIFYFGICATNPINDSASTKISNWIHQFDSINESIHPDTSYYYDTIPPFGLSYRDQIDSIGGIMYSVK